MKNNAPLAEAALTWFTNLTEGTLTPASESTDGNGLASVHWTLGPHQGLHRRALAQCRCDLVAMAAEVECQREAAPYVVEPLDQPRRDLALQEGVIVPTPGGALAAAAQGRAIEDQERVGCHRRVCRAKAGRRVGDCPFGNAFPRLNRAMMLGQWCTTAGRRLLDSVLPPLCLGCNEIVAEPGALCAAC